MVTIIDGKALAKKIREELKIECDTLKKKGVNPNITTSLPLKSILYSSNIFITPYGVQDINVSSPIDNFPTLEGVNPSTSFI